MEVAVFEETFKFKTSVGSASAFTGVPGEIVRKLTAKTQRLSRTL
jgi:hypothetical protein